MSFKWHLIDGLFVERGLWPLTRSVKLGYRKLWWFSLKVTSPLLFRSFGILSFCSGSISTADGSALVKVGNTTVICGIKAVNDHKTDLNTLISMCPGRWWTRFYICRNWQTRQWRHLGKVTSVRTAQECERVHLIPKNSNSFNSNSKEAIKKKWVWRKYLGVPCSILWIKMKPVSKMFWHIYLVCCDLSCLFQSMLLFYSSFLF